MFEFNTFNEAANFLKNEKEIIAYQFIEAIQEGIINEDLIVTALYLKADNKTYAINIKRDYFNDVLDKCLYIFENKENYEYCSLALKLKNNY